MPTIKSSDVIMVHEKRAYIVAAAAGCSNVRCCVGLVQLSLKTLLVIDTFLAYTLVISLNTKSSRSPACEWESVPRDIATWAEFHKRPFLY